MKARFEDEEHKKNRDYMREYVRLHPEKNRERMRKWRLDNPDQYRLSMQSRYSHQARPRKWQSQAECIKAWYRAHPETEIMHKAVRNMLTYSDSKKISKSREYVGCSSGFLRGWLEAQFQPGMTWANYGNVWVVDHVVPLKWWDIENFPQHMMEASHYSNLQPMFKRENIIKGARFAG